MERVDPLTLQCREEMEENIWIICTFDNEAEMIKLALRKHWKVLKLDPVVSRMVPLYPQVTYRKGRSLGEHLVRKIVGTYKCESCKACEYINKTKTFTSYEIVDFVNCRSKLIVYLCRCYCPADYVGKTKRGLRTRMCEHVGDIGNQCDTPLVRHVWEQHSGDTKCISFCAIEKNRPLPRKGNWDRHILQKEAQWIFHLKSSTPNGLNERLTFMCFIYGSTKLAKNV